MSTTKLKQYSNQETEGCLMAQNPFFVVMFEKFLIMTNMSCVYFEEARILKIIFIVDAYLMRGYHQHKEKTCGLGLKVTSFQGINIGSLS